MLVWDSIDQRRERGRKTIELRLVYKVISIVELSNVLDLRGADPFSNVLRGNDHVVTLLLDTVPLRVRMELVGELDNARVIAHGVDLVEVSTDRTLHTTQRMSVFRRYGCVRRR